MTELEKQGQAAQKASKILALASSEQKNQALDRMAAELLAHQKEWLEANRQDVEAAGKAGMNSSFSDRLTLTEERIKGIVEGLRQVALLTDPVGQTDRTILRPNGLRIQRKRVPLGVIALIFEARPNVVADAAALFGQEDRGDARLRVRPCRRAGRDAAVARHDLRHRAAGMPSAGADDPRALFEGNLYPLACARDRRSAVERRLSHLAASHAQRYARRRSGMAIG